MKPPRDSTAIRRWAALLVSLAGALGLAWWLLLDGTPPEPSALDPGADSEQRRGPDEAPLSADAERPGAAGADADAAGRTFPRTEQRIRGLVTDERDDGLADATVVLHAVDPQSVRGAPYRDGPQLAQTTTARDGTFSLSTPTGGWLRVVASAPGRATVAVRLPGPGARIVLRLPPAAGLQVEVLDHTGAAVAAALVRAQVEETHFEARTDAQGTVRFDALPPGTVRTRVEAPGHGSVVSGPVAVRAGAASELLVVLPQSAALGGRALDDETGSPIAGVVVHVGHPGRSDAAAPTGADGRFGPLAGGGVGERVFLAAQAEGYAPLLLPIVIGGPETLEVELRLVRAAPWRGRVVTATGAPAAGAEVAYTSDGIAGRAPASTQADDQGRFELPPPPAPAPGRRVVLHAALGESEAALALRPGSLMPAPLLLTLQAGGLVHGTVRDAEGRPIAGVQVRLTPAWSAVREGGLSKDAAARLQLHNEEGLARLAGASASDGRWSVRNVPAGSFEVRFRWPGGSHWRADVLEVAHGRTDAGAETLGAGGRLAGRLTDRTGQPLAGAQVRLAPAGDSRRQQRTTTGPDGWYEFGGLADGSHGLRASFGTLPPIEERVEISGRAETRLDLQLDEGATLIGQVVGSDGRPFRGVLRIALRRKGSARPDRPPQAVRVTRGTFEVPDVTMGAWLVEATAPDGLSATSDLVEVDAGRTAQVRLTLEPTTIARGHVRTDAGRGAAGATIALLHEDSGRRLLGTAGADGAFTFADLSAGTWHAEFSGRGGAPGTAKFTVRSGQAVKLDWRLGPAGTARVNVRDERGQPIAQALVLFRLPGGGLATRRPIRTDRTGVAVVQDLPPERLVVSARTLDGRRGQAVIAITAGDEAEVDVTVQARTR